MALPITGSAALLEVLAPFVPDEHINELLPRTRGGRRAEWSAAQLYRVLLLLLLTPVRSSNLLCALLPEHRAWRQFAHLRHGRDLPNVRQLHEFRRRLTPMVLRQVNEHLLRRLLHRWPNEQQGIAIMDATDLPAATNEYKKRAAYFLRRRRRSAVEPKRRGRVGGLSATRNTRCGFGCRSIPKAFSSFPW